MRRPRSIAILAAGLAAAACSSTTETHGSGGTALVASGPLPLSTANATAVVGGATCQIGGAQAGLAFAAVLAPNVAGICGFLQANQLKANVRSIQILVFRVDPSSSTASVTPGTYPVVTATPVNQTAYAFVSVSQNDGSCRPSTVVASSGSVIVTSVADGAVKGTVTAELAVGGTVSGAFDAPECAVTFPGDACGGNIGLANPTCVP